MKKNVLKLMVAAAVLVAGTTQNADALSLADLKSKIRAALHHQTASSQNAQPVLTASANTTNADLNTPTNNVVATSVVTTNNVTGNSVTGQNITGAGNNSVNGSPG